MISVLLVDDEESLLDIGAHFLSAREQISVQPASSALIATKLLKESSFDAVVSDYDMPEMNGIAFLKTIRSEYNDVPFILFTGKGREEVVIDAINNGADFYVQKGGDPKIQFAELAHKIRQAVDKHQAYATIREKNEEIKQVAEEARMFVTLQTREEILSHLGDVLSACIRDSIIVTVPSSQDETVVIHSIHGMSPEETDQINTILNVSLFSEKFNLTPNQKAILETGKLFRHQGSLSRFVEGMIPDDICDALQEAFHLTHIYSIGLTTGTADGGSIYIFCSDGHHIRNPQNIETLAFQASLALERVHTTKLLKEQETGYTNIFTHIEDVYYRTDIGGHIVQVSPSALRVFGYESEDEIRGISVIPLWVDSDDFCKKHTRLFQTGAVNDFEARLFRKDGSIIEVSLTSHLIYDGNGTICGTEGVIRDISLRKQKEAEIISQEAYYRGICDECPFGIIGLTTNPDETKFLVKTMNQAAEEILGCCSADFSCQEITAIIPAESQEEFIDALRYVSMTGEPRSITLFQNTVKGQDIPFDIEIRRLPSEDLCLFLDLRPS